MKRWTATPHARPAKSLLREDDPGAAVQQVSDAGVSEAVVPGAAGRPMGVVTREGILEAWRRVTLAG